MIWRDMAEGQTKSLGPAGGPQPFIPTISCEPQKIVDLWLQIAITFIAVAVTYKYSDANAEWRPC